MTIRAKHIGAIVGLGVGWIIVTHGIVAGVFVGVVAAFGWVIGRVVDGDLDVAELIPRRRDPDEAEYRDR